MEQLIEVIRRAALAAVWIGGLGLAILLGISSFNDGGILMFGASGIVMISTWATAKLINWILGA